MTESEELERAVIGDFISLESIQSCEKNYKKKLEASTMDDDTKFSYGWHLIKSRYKDDIRKGIRIMGELCKDGVDQRDYLYFMGMGYYKLEEFTEAEECIDRVLNMEPNNEQAKQLKHLIVQKMRRDNLITAGVVVGGAALVGAAAVGTLALLGAAVVKFVSR